MRIKDSVRLPGRSFVPMIVRDGHVRAALAHRRLVREANRLGDDDLGSNAPWSDLVPLLNLARGARLIVELGTGSAWTALILAADNPGARVVSVDPFDRGHRDEYVRLLDRGNLELRRQSGAQGPQELRAVDLLFIDSSHEYEQTLAEFHAWEPVVRPGGQVAFHDYPGWEGVRRAVDALALGGEPRGFSLYVWDKQAAP